MANPSAEMKWYIQRVRRQVQLLAGDTMENDGTFVTVRAAQLQQLVNMVQDEMTPPDDMPEDREAYRNEQAEQMP